MIPQFGQTPLEQDIATNLGKTPLELVKALKAAGHVDSSVDEAELAADFEREIARFNKVLDSGFCGIPLPTKLSYIVEG